MLKLTPDVQLTEAKSLLWGNERRLLSNQSADYARLARKEAARSLEGTDS